MESNLELNRIPVITSVDTSLSDRCNLNCSFCYTHGGCGNDFNQARIDKTFTWLFDQFEAGANEHQRKWGISIAFYGGEPLVEWEHLKDVVLTKKALAEEKKIRLKFGIVTNMTLLTADKLDWLIENNVSISPSIDGCQPAQDAERKYHDGSGSSAVVYENARRYLATRNNASCRMTVSPASVGYVYDSILFLTTNLGFKQVNAILAGGVEWTDEKLEIFKQQIEKVTNWWIEEMRIGKHWDLYHIRNMLLGLWNARRMPTLCQAGIKQIGIDTRGNFYPCHRFCNLDSKPEYLLGNLDTGYTNVAFADKIRTYDVALANAERCKDCPAVMGCHGFCTHEMMVAGKGMFEPLPHYCKIWPFYWKMAVRAHSLLMAENNQLYLKQYNPWFRPQRAQLGYNQRGVKG